MKKRTRPRRNGSRAGVPNLEYLTVHSYPARCPTCGSTDREPYKGTPDVHEVGGTDVATGKPFNRIVFRNTKCANCGQALRVREYQYLPPEKK